MFALDSSTKNPMALFETWIADAWKSQVPEADAMALATATRAGIPSVRFVLFKGVEAGKVLFYTNYTSRKADELDSNPHAALAFYWPAVKRQIRIEGNIARTTREQSQRYFISRPRGSQLAAMASHQSQPIAAREDVEAKIDALEKKFAAQAELTCPEFWGGYTLEPTAFEFWSAGEFRVHDRLRFSKEKNDWSVSRLSP